jgi:copper resistance protein B
MLPSLRVAAALILGVAIGAPVSAERAQETRSAADLPAHRESARQQEGPTPPEIDAPPLPEGMTLDEVLDRAGSPPPVDYPDPVPDDRWRVFTLVEQLEYRLGDDDNPDRLGWEAQGWLGGDFHKLWWKSEGEAVFQGPDGGESETDLLYSRLISPFWSFQIGVQYANEWMAGDYGDRWSGVIALQGLAPYEFELDNSLYVSEEGDVTLEFEGEYDVRVTQRLVFQPRTELGFAFQDIPDRDLGAGMTDASLDLRLRYEVKREFAPYLGVRYRLLVGETANIAEAAGRDTGQLYFFAGLRFAF